MLGNAAIPFFTVLSFWAVGLFPLVVALEACLARWNLGLPWRSLVGPLLVANTASCVIGICGLHVVGWPTALLSGPVTGDVQWLFWMFPGSRIGHSIAGLALMLGACCLLSIWLESLLLRRWWSEIAPERLRSFARWAHLPVYVVWFIVGATVLISEPRHPY